MKVTVTSRTVRCDRGFTVAEMVIASVILFVVLMGVIGAVAFSAQSVQMQKRREQASNIANAHLEEARNLPYDQLGTATGNPPGAVPVTDAEGDYTVQTAIKWRRDPVTLLSTNKEVIVRVSWTTPAPGTVTLATAMYGRSTLVNTGDVEVHARYRSSTNPVPGVRFAIHGIADTTDPDGVAFLGKVPIGTYDLHVSGVPVGYTYDPAEVSNQTVVADRLTPVNVSFQKPSTVVYTVSDAATTNRIPNATVTVRDGSGTTVDALHTDGAGQVTFSGLRVGTYNVHFEAETYQSASQALSITQEDSTQNIDITLSPMPTTGSVEVKVVDNNKTILPNAKVVLRDASGAQTTLTTASNGVATFTSVSPGDYTITCSLAGYTDRTVPLSVKAGDALSITVDMSGTYDAGMDITTYKRGLLGGIVLTGSIRVIVSGPGYYNDSLYSNPTLIGILFPGRIRVRGLLPGTYSVQTYQKPASVVTVIVSAGKISDVTVTQNR